MLQNRNKQLFQRIQYNHTGLRDWTKWKQDCKDCRNSSLLSILWETSRTFSAATAEPHYKPQCLESPLSFHICANLQCQPTSAGPTRPVLGDKGQADKLEQLYTQLGITPQQDTGKGLSSLLTGSKKGAAQGQMSCHLCLPISMFRVKGECASPGRLPLSPQAWCQKGPAEQHS